MKFCTDGGQAKSKQLKVTYVYVQMKWGLDYYQEDSRPTPSNKWSKLIPISSDVNEHLSVAALLSRAEKLINELKHKV